MAAVKMADISGKDITKRVAIAEGKIYVKKATIDAISKGKIVKGDVLVAANIAGIMAAKKTSDLIPLCHPLEITDVKINFKLNKNSITVSSEVSCLGRTGVEMEALVAVSVAALTIYDMCKPIDKDMVISDIKLLKKTGGKSEVAAKIHSRDSLQGGRSKLSP